MKKTAVFSVVLMGIAVFLAVGFSSGVKASAKKMELSEKSQACVECHAELHPGIVKPWEGSAHSDSGVGCFECHSADKTDKDAFEHEGETIAIIVSPKDCASCHKAEVDEMTGSHHAKANKFTGSLDNVLGRIVTGEANFNLGCSQCHGSDVEVEEGGKLKVGAWPNTGIGRKNPDGSLGACVACHQRHSFDLKQVREPKTCGKCHQGPDHPQIEIYELSKHGIAYAALEDKSVYAKKDLVLGRDYFEAPVCSTCHMGATRETKRTHDVGARLKWTLRPPISKVLPNGDKKREEMKSVCSECHTSGWIDGFFTQFDSYVELYNDKFARPATDIIKFLKKEGVTDITPFNEQVEIDYWHLWHHEGRRGRHGAAMHAPDWSHWHGMYEVALNFYFHLIPHADKAVKEKGSAATQQKWNALKSEILNRKEHKWQAGLPKAELRKIVEFYQKRYGKEGGQ
jgi:hydroxylamine dehydrogenase